MDFKARLTFHEGKLADNVVNPEHVQEKGALSRLLLADLHEKKAGIIKVKVELRG